MHKIAAILCVLSLAACASQKSAPIVMHDNGNSTPPSTQSADYPTDIVPFRPVFNSVKQSQPAPVKEMEVKELKPRTEVSVSKPVVVAGVPVPKLKPELVSSVLQENDGFKPFFVRSRVTERSKLIWPVSGKVISKFGHKSGGLYNDGVNIAAPEGAFIRAAMAGTVAYTGNDLPNYGNLVILRHKNGWLTAYAHTKEFKVAKGQRVKLGQVIATVGHSGNVSKSQVHFAIRNGKKPVDPVLKVKG